MKSIAHAGLLVALLAAPLAAQSEVLGNDDVVLQRFEPQNYSPMQLHQALQMMHGRSLHFADRQVQNIIVLADREIVIYDTPANVERILAAARELDGTGTAGTESGELAFAAQQLQLETYAPRHGNSYQIAEVASQMFGRVLEVDGREVQNIRALDDAILVYDTAEQAQRILGSIERVDAAAELVAGERLEVLEYRPRWVSLQTIEAAVQPFSRPMANQVSGMAPASNVSTLREQGLLVARDTAETLEQICAVIDRVDRPAPQAILSCSVLRGVAAAAGRPAPEELSRNLRALLPYTDYERVALGMLRVSAVSGSHLAISMESAPEENENWAMTERFELRMEIDSYDPGAAAMSLSDCTFNVMDPRRGATNLFTTSATVHGDEYAVLGVAGASPLFVVLQVSPAATGEAH